MAFCSKCGAQIKDNEKYCPKCGAPTQSQAESNDIESNRVMAILSYIGLLILIPLFAGDYKNSPYLKFHLNQGIIFCALWGLTIVLGFVIPVAGFVIGGLLSILITVAEIYCIIGAVKGEKTEIPLLGDIKILN